MQQKMSFSANDFPAEIWLFDRVPTIDATQWRLGVLSLGFSLAELSGVFPRREVQAVLETLRAEREITVLLCTHDMDEAAALCDRVLMLDGGRVLADASPEELRRQHGAATLEDVFMHLTGKRLEAEEVEEVAP